jgi:hypothetical protein
MSSSTEDKLFKGFWNIRPKFYGLNVRLHVTLSQISDQDSNPVLDPDIIPEPKFLFRFNN